MLTELRVRDLAVIADVTLRLERGLNVITGETGAGKSILVDALSLLLGERASIDLVRPGASRAVVEAAFEVEEHGAFAEMAAEAGLEIEEGRFVVRREINSQGRNRAWANGSPTTVGVLADLGTLLVDLHGQHESQSLLRPATQRDILDAFGGADPERRAILECFTQAQALRREERELGERRDEIRRRADYLKHVVHEIDEIDPKPGEDDDLATEIKRLTHAEDLTGLAERLVELLDGETPAVGELLGEAQRTLHRLERIDATVDQWRPLLETASASASELAREARDYLASIEIDPERLERLQGRQDRLYKLHQKYGSSIADVTRTRDQAQAELDVLDTADFDLAAIAGRRGRAEQALYAVAESLSAKRKAAIEKLTGAVGVLLPLLGMRDGRVLPEITASANPGPTGADTVTFKVQLNPGIDPRPLAQVASGGELSRIMLALKVVLAQHDRIPTLVFDEVDQGIGGEIGAQVAEALASVAREKQVIVITHLPQIAARADHHLLVGKGIEEGIAAATVHPVRGEERVEEIARMLGDPRDPVLRLHASELVERRERRLEQASSKEHRRA